MTEKVLRFYNMTASLVNQNKIYEENVAIKNLWEKDGGMFLDIYFYRTQKSYIIDSLYIHKVVDLVTEKVYASPAEFLKDYYDETAPLTKATSKKVSLIDKKIFSPLEVPIILMTFIAKSCDNFTLIKMRIIYNYILENIPDIKALSEQYVFTYLESLDTNETTFYNALSKIKDISAKKNDIIFKEVLKIAFADGQLHYLEKFYLAEYIQTLREQGIVLDVKL